MTNSQLILKRKMTFFKSIRKKQSKWSFYSIQTNSLKKTNLELMTERWKLKANCKETSIFFRSKTFELSMCIIWLMIRRCIIWNFVFRQKFKNSYAIVENIIENLRRMYDDFNHRFIAVNQFRDLKMKKKQFHRFLNRFSTIVRKIRIFRKSFFRKIYS